MCGVGVALGVGGAATAFAAFAIAGRSDPLPGGIVAAWIAHWFWYVLLALMFIYVPLLFPTGGPPSRRWRPVLTIAVVVTVAVVAVASLDPVFEGQDGAYTIANPIGVDAVGDVEEGPLGGLLFGVFGGCAFAAFASLVVRFRRARGGERAQIKWVAYASGVLVANILVEELLGTVASEIPFAITIALVPVSIAAAVLRYRLYDIDRLISRTISYAVVTAALVATYVVLVVALQAVVPVRGDLAVAASTLTAAALFHPLRRRVQAAVDRRFNRARYDAARTIGAFSQRLRSQVDLAALA